jgi:hypothetical protein
VLYSTQTLSLSQVSHDSVLKGSSNLRSGITQFTPNENIADVAKRLPGDSSRMFMIYSPIEDHEHRLTRAVGHMVVDQTVLTVDKNGALSLLSIIDVLL